MKKTNNNKNNNTLFIGTLHQMNDLKVLTVDKKHTQK